MMRNPRTWRIQRSERLFEHPLLRLERQRLLSNDDSGHRRDVLVLDTTDWVNVIALLGPTSATREGDRCRVLMVRQWRYAVAEPTLEIPGGMVDRGESPEQAAARELLEETGYRAGSLRRLGTVQPNPALFNNRCSTWLAEKVERIGHPVGDGDEEIEVITVPLTEIPGRIAAGEIEHALVVAAFHLFELSRSTTR